jgi:hypothetical protein
LRTALGDSYALCYGWDDQGRIAEGSQRDKIDAISEVVYEFPCDTHFEINSSIKYVAKCDIFATYLIIVALK